MKFAAVVLLACVAVSSAAFTANLVQKTQPALDEAMFKVRLAAGNKAITIPAINQIFETIQTTVQNLLAQAQQIVQAGQQIGQNLYNQLMAAAQALQGIAGAVAPQVQAVIQNLIQSIYNILGLNKGLFGLDLAALIQHAQAAIQQAIALAQSLIDQIDFQSLFVQAVNQYLPPQVAQLVIAHLGLSNKGIFDIFGELFGNLWGQITGAANQIAQQISQIASQIANIGQSAFAAVQEQAAQFVSQVAQGVSTLTAQAAAEILQNISQLQEALGNQYQAVVDALNAIILQGKSF